MLSNVPEVVESRGYLTHEGHHLVLSELLLLRAVLDEVVEVRPAVLHHQGEVSHDDAVAVALDNVRVVEAAMDVELPGEDRLFERPQCLLLVEIMTKASKTQVNLRTI